MAHSGIGLGLEESDAIPRVNGTGAAESIDRSSPLPLYIQIKRRLMSMLMRWEDAERRFHTDDELCRMFGVSRYTVRQAVQDLVSSGYLYRVQGLGTFVGSGKVDEQFTPAMTFIDQWAVSGRELKMRVQVLERRPAPADVAAALQVSAGEPVLYLRRLRESAGTPVSIDHRFLPLRFAAAVDERTVETRSLLDVLREHVELSHGDMRIEAGLSDPETAEFLELLPGDPLLVRTLVYFDVAGMPVMAGRSVYRADQVRYAVRLPLSQQEGLGAAQLVEMQAEMRRRG